MRFVALLLTTLIAASIAEAQQDRAAKTLQVWDTNGDGVLTPDEFPDQATFKKADRDSDGKVTRDEIAIFLGLKKAPKEPAPEEKEKPKPKPAPKPNTTKTDGGMKKAPRTIPERVRDFFERLDRDKNRKVDQKESPGIGEDMWKRFDRNKDKAFNVKEATRYIRYTITEAKKRPNRANFFDLFDKNRDNKVTRREYDGPTMFFKSYDHNKNNAVTLEELNMGPNAGRSKNNKQMQQDKNFMADGPTKAPKMGLLERYDKNEDGRITLEELGGAEALMQRLDKNRDGVLSGGETK
ncbi:MAG: hypothetical protein ACYTGZ_17700 [Planctomycetota bacterium]|jgi:Ca2+-binding EF-hand superfamily protein